MRSDGASGTAAAASSAVATARRASWQVRICMTQSWGGVAVGGDLRFGTGKAGAGSTESSLSSEIFAGSEGFFPKIDGFCLNSPEKLIQEMPCSFDNARESGYAFQGKMPFVFKIETDRGVEVRRFRAWFQVKRF